MVKRDKVPARAANRMACVLRWTLLCVATLVVGFATDASADAPASVPYAAGNYGTAPGGGDVDTATGTATASYPIVFPPARGRSQPILSLTYAHTAGFSEVGQGWSLGLPVIERRGLAGQRPRFDPNDVYELSGVQLVLLCTDAGACSTVNGTVKMPPWAAAEAWTVFRPAIDSAYTRAFESSNGLTWRVETRSGDILEFGAVRLVSAALDHGGNGAFDLANPSDLSKVVRWKLTAQADAYASAPVNVILYSWASQVFDQDYPDGTPREFGVAAWNASIALIASSDPNPISSYLVRRYLTIHEVGGSSAADLGQLAPLAVALVLGGGGSAAEAAAGHALSGGGASVGAAEAGAGAAEARSLFHYTTEAGHAGIVESRSLNPSLRSLNPADVRYGNGQYLSDIVPGSQTSAQLSRQFLGMPFQGWRFTHFVQIDVGGLDVIRGRAGVFVVPNEVPLDLTGRILGSGLVP